MNTQEMQDILAAQKQAHLAAPYPSFSERRDRLQRMVDMLLTHRGKFCEALDTDFNGRGADMSLAIEFMPTVNVAKYVLKNLRKWMRPERRHASFPFNLAGAKAEIRYLPLGVVGNISPWNFPVNLTFGPLSAILAAGNRAMIKPSELSEASSALMAELVPRYFDATELAVVTGDASVAAEFSALPFDHLLFTGSTAVGRHVMSAAAKNLVPVTLELGGKSPVIVSRSADIKDAARKIMFGKSMNAGQICIAPDYVLVPEDMQAEMLEALRSAFSEMYSDPQANPDYTHIINPRHFERLQGLLNDARDQGASLHPLGAGEPDANSRFFPPYALTQVPSEAKINREEIFGPLLPVRSYRDIDDARELISAGDRPLALYYFGKDGEEIDVLADCVISGGMVVNDVLMHYLQDDLPFGGVGASGMGRYHGIEGFRSFSHARSVYHQSPFDVGKLMRPPFKKRRRLVDSQLKQIS